MNEKSINQIHVSNNITSNKSVSIDNQIILDIINNIEEEVTKKIKNKAKKDLKSDIKITNNSINTPIRNANLNIGLQTSILSAGELSLNVECLTNLIKQKIALEEDLKNLKTGTDEYNNLEKKIKSISNQIIISGGESTTQTAKTTAILTKTSETMTGTANVLTDIGTKVAGGSLLGISALSTIFSSKSTIVNKMTTERIKKEPEIEQVKKDIEPIKKNLLRTAKKTGQFKRITFLSSSISTIGLALTTAGTAFIPLGWGITAAGSLVLFTHIHNKIRDYNHCKKVLYTKKAITDLIIKEVPMTIEVPTRVSKQINERTSQLSNLKVMTKIEVTKENKSLILNLLLDDIKSRDESKIEMQLKELYKNYNEENKNDLVKWFSHASGTSIEDCKKSLEGKLNSISSFDILMGKINGNILN